MQVSIEWKIYGGILLSFGLIWIFAGFFYLIRRYLVPNGRNEVPYELLHQHFDDDEIEFSKSIERTHDTEHG
jgi:hypothetical protein